MSFVSTIKNWLSLHGLISIFSVVKYFLILFIHSLQNVVYVSKF